MTRPDVRLHLPERDLLGESPLWDWREQALYWVDTRRRRVQRWREGQGVQHWSTPSDVGSIALAQPGRLLLALEDGFATLDLQGGEVRRLADVMGQVIFPGGTGRLKVEARRFLPASLPAVLLNAERGKAEQPRPRHVRDQQADADQPVDAFGQKIDRRGCCGMPDHADAEHELPGQGFRSDPAGLGQQ